MEHSHKLLDVQEVVNAVTPALLTGTIFFWRQQRQPRIDFDFGDEIVDIRNYARGLDLRISAHFNTDQRKDYYFVDIISTPEFPGGTLHSWQREATIVYAPDGTLDLFNTARFFGIDAHQTLEAGAAKLDWAQDLMIRLAVANNTPLTGKVPRSDVEKFYDSLRAGMADYYKAREEPNMVYRRIGPNGWNLSIRPNEDELTLYATSDITEEHDYGILVENQTGIPTRWREQQMIYAVGRIQEGGIDVTVFQTIMPTRLYDVLKKDLVDKILLREVRLPTHIDVRKMNRLLFQKKKEKIRDWLPIGFIKP